jgi:hypothetical protein
VRDLVYCNALAQNGDSCHAGWQLDWRRLLHGELTANESLGTGVSRSPGKAQNSKLLRDILGLTRRNKVTGCLPEGAGRRTSFTVKRKTTLIRSDATADQ